MRIAIKYCGGCNPAIERGELAFRLAQAIRNEQLDWNLVSLQGQDFDYLVVINGCAVGCAGKQFEAEDKPVLIVAGESLQHKRIAEKDLPAEIIRKILQFGEEARKQKSV
jgi:hypothetical protein